jgi:NADH-quinone oxidoreductase subunit C
MAKLLTTFVPAPVPAVDAPGAQVAQFSIDDLAAKVQTACGADSLVSVHKEHKGDPFLLVSPAKLHQVVAFLRDSSELSYISLSVISATDFLPTKTAEGAEVAGRVEVLYVLFSFKNKHQVSVKVHLPRETPEVDSISDLYRAAVWYERECYDMIGVVYKNHPYLKRILLPQDWVGYPLRRDYVFPQEYNGMKVPL